MNLEKKTLVAADQHFSAKITIYRSIHVALIDIGYIYYKTKTGYTNRLCGCPVIELELNLNFIELNLNFH